ncbi:MAG: glycosyltransferase family 4 protein [Candidatus Erginobacter occultus]|nr:glycosyltransferase family 4 protein [Candidatus Erginobacter occultus]
MKILFIIVGDFSPVSGVGRTCYSLAHRLARDREVTVVASGNYRGEEERIKFLQAPFWHPGKAWEFFLPLPVIWNFLLAGVLCRHYRKRFDIIHVFNGLVWSKNALITLQMCQKGAFRAAWGKSFREQLGKKTPKHLSILFLEWLIYRWQLFRGLVVCSRAERDEIIRYYQTDSEKIHRLYNGIDLISLSPGEVNLLRTARRNELGYRESDRVCLFVGYDLKRKGFEAVLRALARLPREYKLLVVGGGDKKGDFRRTIVGEGLESRVRFAGQQHNPSPFYAAADLFILPTLHEPFGTAILEAMNWGLPVITSRLAGAAELITPGREGCLLDDPRDGRAIAAFVRQIGEEGKAAEMGAAGRETARTSTWERRAGELLDLYRRLV